jgi:hypothetical protein
MIIEKCHLCGDNLSGIFISLYGGGIAHPHCYHRKHPPYKPVSLYEVARGSSDTLLAAEIIADMVPPKLAQKIVERYNEERHAAWLRQCES